MSVHKKILGARKLIKPKFDRWLESLAPSDTPKPEIKRKKKKIKIEAPRKSKRRSTCAICELFAEKKERTKHHLIPRSLDKRVKERRETIVVDKTCHKKIHKFFSNKELAEEFNTVESLKKEFERRKKLNEEGKFRNYNDRRHL